MAFSLSFSGVVVAQQDKDVRADEAGRAERQAAPPRAPARNREAPPQRANEPARYADPRGFQPERGRDVQQRAERPRDDGRRGYDNRGDGWRQQRDERARYDGRRGAGPDHNFYRGGHLPREYRGYEYVVDDWRGHRLSAPPRGYHWVQAGGDYVLVAIATGVILSILLSQ